VDTNTLKVDSSNNRVGINEASPTSELTFGSNSTIEMVGGSSKLLFKRSDTTTIAGNPLGAIEFSHTDTDDAGTAAKIIGEGDGSSGEGRLAFHTGTPSGLSESMRIDGSGGHVGINNTTPGSYLEGELVVGNSTKDQYINVVTGTGNAAGLCFQDTTGTSIVGGLRYTHSDNALASWTNGSERMRLSSSGDLILGTTSTIGPAQFNVDGGSQAGIGIRAGNGTSGYFNQVLFANNGNTALIGSIQRVNNASVQYNTTSDARLKENIADMTGAITRVKQLVPKRYSWVEEDLDAADQDGFLAHEAQAVVPGAVSGTQDEVDGDGNPVYMQMDYSKLVPLLTAALKESIAKIETLEAKVAALEGN